MIKLIDIKEIEKRTKQIAEQIKTDYENDQPLICICVLKGAIMFFTELIKNLSDMDIIMDFITLSSYSKKDRCEVKCLHDINSDVKGKNVLVVEDIIDSGSSVLFLKDYFIKREVKSIKICTLLDKINIRKNKISVDYNCFNVEKNDFLVGFGLDFNQLYRNKDGIFVLE